MNALVKRIEDFADNFDPFLEDELLFGHDLNPYLRIAELRQQAAVIKGEYRVLMGLPSDITTGHLPHYTVTRYREVEQVFANPQLFSNAAYTFNLGISFGRSVSTMDAPEHVKFRKIFQKAFLPQTVAKWGDTIVDPVVTALMEKFMHRGSVDLVQEFTLHYPFHVIYKQLDMPLDDIKVFHKLAIAQTVTAIDIPHGVEASRKLGIYFSDLLEQRRRRPGTDIVSLLAQAEADGEKLPDEVLISFLRQLINAGGDTTYRATSVLLTGLLSNPEQLDAVRKDRALIPQAIEEALRWDGPVLSASRMTTAATTLGDLEIPAGAVLDVLSGSANRDEQFFPNPDQFDIFRKPAHRHFSFAFGPHVCIGQHLARVEMTRALNAVLDRLPNVRLDPQQSPPEIRGIMMRIPKHIHVRFD
jgi:cytochrome P450